MVVRPLPRWLVLARGSAPNLARSLECGATQRQDSAHPKWFASRSRMCGSGHWVHLFLLRKVQPGITNTSRCCGLLARQARPFCAASSEDAMLEGYIQSTRSLLVLGRGLPEKACQAFLSQRTDSEQRGRRPRAWEIPSLANYISSSSGRGRLGDSVFLQLGLHCHKRNTSLKGIPLSCKMRPGSSGRGCLEDSVFLPWSVPWKITEIEISGGGGSSCRVARPPSKLGRI